jgi:FSR family fosmidomycin resistance protein-like MFS transporter
MDIDADLGTHRGLSVAWAFGLMHAVVDASSAAVLMWGTGIAATSSESPSCPPNDLIWHRFLLFTVLAFGTQFSLGAVADRWKAYWGMAMAGLAMIAIAAESVAAWPLAAIVLAALGNAAFHVGSGALVLTRWPQQPAAAGILIGPGAVGLSVGLWCGQSLTLRPWLLLGPLVVSAGVALALRKAVESGSTPCRRPAVLRGLPAIVCLAAILLSIAIRSANGQGVSAVHEHNTSVLWGLAIANSMGNILGGVLAGRLGWVSACVLPLLLSAPLLSVMVDEGAVAIAGMLFFQMTMPITLMAMFRVLPNDAGLAFGLSALAVLAGVVPVYISPSEWITSPPLLLSLTLISLAAILIGLPPIVRQDEE